MGKKSGSPRDTCDDEQSSPEDHAGSKKNRPKQFFVFAIFIIDRYVPRNGVLQAQCGEELNESDDRQPIGKCTVMGNREKPHHQNLRAEVDAQRKHSSAQKQAGSPDLCMGRILFALNFRPVNFSDSIHHVWFSLPVCQASAEMPLRKPRQFKFLRETLAGILLLLRTAMPYSLLRQTRRCSFRNRVSHAAKAAVSLSRLIGIFLTRDALPVLECQTLSTTRHPAA